MIYILLFVVSCYFLYMPNSLDIPKAHPFITSSQQASLVSPMSGLYLILLPVTIIFVTLTVFCCVQPDQSVENLSSDQMLAAKKLSELLDNCIYYKTQDMLWHDRWIDYLINLSNEINSLQDVHSSSQLDNILENYRSSKLKFFQVSWGLHTEFLNCYDQVNKHLISSLNNFFSDKLNTLKSLDDLMQIRFEIMCDLEAEINKLL